MIGAGAAGRTFALACAAAGFDVILEDVMPANLRKAEAEYADLPLHEAQREVPREAVRETPGRLLFASTVEDAVRDADIAVDFVPDELESKLEIFSMIDRMAPPKTILCTPSDALSITDLASCVYRPERCVAVRGGLLHKRESIPSSIDLLYPANTASATIERVSAFFRVLTIEVRPMLP